MKQNLIKRFINRFSSFYWRFIVSPEKYARHIGVKIGHDCFISTREWSSEPYLITIGNNVQITRNVLFNTHGGGHCLRNCYPKFDVFGKIEIKDWVYVGANSQIMPGVTIGEGALIAGGSIVTKSVAPHTVVAGNPARFICSTQEYYEKNKGFNIDSAGMKPEDKKKLLLSLSEELFLKK